MTSSTVSNSYDRDWRVLKGVVSALWISAALAFLAVQYFLPRDHDIVVSASKPAVLAGQAAP